MSLRVATGHLTKSTTGVANATNVVTGLGFQPKALILFHGGRTSAGSFANDYRGGFGVSDGSSHYCLAWSAQNGVATSNTSRAMRDKGIAVITYGESLDSEASVSLDSDGFTLTWTTNGTTGYIIQYVALGGTSLSAKVATWTTNAGTGSQSVSGIGFQPTAGFIGSYLNAAAIPSLVTSDAHVIGMVDSAGNSHVLAVRSADATSTTARVDASNQNTDSIVRAVTQGVTPSSAVNVTFTSWDSDGFTFNIVTGETSRPEFGLFLRGLNTKVGTWAKATGAAPASDSVSGVGFLPMGALFFSNGETGTGVPSSARTTIGAIDATGAMEGALTEDSGAINTQAQGYISSSHAIILNSDADTTINAFGDWTSWDSGGFTLSWSTNNAVATQIGYILFGATADTVTPTAGSLTLTGTVPSIGLGVAPAAGSLTLSGSTPTVAVGTLITPIAATLALTGATPGLTLTVAPTAGSLTLSGGTPGLTATVAPAAASLTLTGSTPSLDLTVVPAPVSLVLTGSVPTFPTTLTLTPTAGSLVLTGSIPTITVGTLSILAPRSPGGTVAWTRSPGASVTGTRTPGATVTSTPRTGGATVS